MSLPPDGWRTCSEENFVVTFQETARKILSWRIAAIAVSWEIAVIASVMVVVRVPVAIAATDCFVRKEMEVLRRSRVDTEPLPESLARSASPDGIHP